MKIAEENTVRTNTQVQNTVQFVKIVSIQEAGREDVYNMEVLRHHNFSICGGFVVHNCLDALRYFCMTIIRMRPGIRILK